jgi:hypothetical protein
MNRSIVHAFIAAVIMCLATHGQCTNFSGSSRSVEQSKFTTEDIAAFSKKFEHTLAAEGAHVAIVARMGRLASDMPEGMHFTHAAFAVYSEITTKDGRKLPGYAIYNLYQKNDRPDQSELIQDFPLDFFYGVAQLEAGIIIPSVTLQERILKIISSSSYASLHEPHYSLIANPYTLGRQNCTEFVLDVINAAIYQTNNLRTLKTYAKSYFDAQNVNVNPLKLMLGSMFSSEVSLSDQTGKPVTATFEKIADYLKSYDKDSKVIYLLP